MQTRLQDGDILFDLTDNDPIDIAGKSKTRVFKEIVLNLEQDQEEDDKDIKLEEVEGRLIHGRVHDKGSIYESAEGDNFLGVMKHDLLKAYQTKKQHHDPGYDSDEEEPKKIESRIIVRCKDKELGRLFGETCARWYVRLTPAQLEERRLTLDEAKERQVTPLGRIKSLLFVPYLRWDLRNQDASDRSKMYEIYRAFRAYMRNHSSPVLPLTKHKGVSCNQFIAYSLKSAMIERLLPKEVIDLICKKVLEIENIKAASDKNKQRISKLGQIPQKYFIDFDELVTRCFIEARESKDHCIKDREKYIEYLYTPVKRSSIDQFGITILQNPDIFDFAGYFCIVTDGHVQTPAVLDHDSYCALIAKTGESHDVLITQKEIDDIKSAERKATADTSLSGAKSSERASTDDESGAPKLGQRGKM